MRLFPRLDNLFSEYCAHHWIPVFFHPPHPGLSTSELQCRVQECWAKLIGRQEIILAPVQTVPDSWIVANCPLCGEKSRYLPADIFRGRLSNDLLAKSLWIADRR